jgi:glutathione synthase
MRILVLTDHGKHTPNNSVYKLCEALSKQSDVSKLVITSRGDDRNADFFSGSSNIFYGSVYSEGFNYPADKFFSNSDLTFKLSSFDIIFLRLPRPLETSFFDHITMLFDESRIVNRPEGILLTSNKKYLLNLTDYTPPVAYCESWEDILKFYNRFPIILKPLEDYGGRGIVRLADGFAETADLKCSMWDWKAKYYDKDKQPYLAMKYLKNVSLGDKRIVVAGGKILSASLRRPVDGEWLCNVSQGGTPEPSEADKREKEIVDYLSPMLLEEGIFYYGLDTLVDDDGKRIISEINTLSIGGIAPSEELTGIPYSKIFADLFVKYCMTL